MNSGVVWNIPVKCAVLGNHFLSCSKCINYVSLHMSVFSASPWNVQKNVGMLKNFS